MAKQFLKRILPQQQALEHHRLLKLFGQALFHPSLWRLHRRNVAGGVAAGLFFGLVPGPVQMLGAGLAAILFKWNLPVAVFTTLYTNPITFIPLYLVGLQIGLLLLNAVARRELPDGSSAELAFPPPPDFVWTAPIDSSAALVSWSLGMGWPLFVGVLTLALLLSVTGYLLVRIVWSGWIRFEIIRRRRRTQRKKTEQSSRNRNDLP